VLLSYMLALARKKRQAEELIDSIGNLRRFLADQAQQMDRLKDNNNQLREISMTDPLTGLSNARYMQQWLTQAFAYATRYNEPLSVIFLDLDHFKWINDCYGHLSGDNALKFLASVLKNSVRDSDLVARYAGDEFLIALPNTPADQLPVLAERILKQLKANPMESGGEAFTISCSMGSATFPAVPPVATYQELLNLADQALYAATRQRPFSTTDSGGIRYLRFDPLGFDGRIPSTGRCRSSWRRVYQSDCVGAGRTGG